MDQSTLTNNMKHQIRIKSQFLCISLHLALEKMNGWQNGWTWNKCCTEAITISKKMGISTVNNAKTVERRYRSFCNKCLFIVPTKTKDNLPPFLDLNPKAYKAIKKYGNCNLASMSVEVMSQHIHHMILPQIIEKERQEKIRAGEMNASEVQKYERESRTLLKRYGLTCICPGTVYRWMKKLGFNYEPQKKSY